MRFRLLPFVLIPLLAACTSKVVDRAADGPVPAMTDDMEEPVTPNTVVGSNDVALVAPVLSVERFLRAVNSEDLESMRQLFGTARGPAEGDPLQLERELALIAQILQHEDYEVVSDRREFGKANLTHRVGVDLTIDGNVVSDVGFSVVQSSSGRWFVEVIELEKVTRG